MLAPLFKNNYAAKHSQQSTANSYLLIFSIHRQVMPHPPISALLELLDSITDQRMDPELVNYATQKDAANIAKNLRVVEAVLSDAETKQFTEDFIGDWVSELKDACYDLDGVLDELNSANRRSITERPAIEAGNSLSPEKVCFFVPSCCFRPIQIRPRIRGRYNTAASKMRQLNVKLDIIAARIAELGLHQTPASEREATDDTYNFNEPQLYGRSEEKDILISKLLSVSESSHGRRENNIIAIVGMGGIGKTTLAKHLYNDNEVKGHFDARIWICVGDPFDEITIAKAIIEAIKGLAPNLFEFESLLRDLRESIQGKKFILVLDDVWTKDYYMWEALELTLQKGACGSKILVTTRNEGVAVMMGGDMIGLTPLTSEASWSMFTELGFFGRDMTNEQLKAICKQVLSKCKGLPLLVKLFGGAVQFEKRIEEWEKVLRSSELWELNDFEEIFRPFLMFYNRMSPLEKRCFLYCSVFPKNYEMYKENLIKMWMSQGYWNDQKKDFERGLEYCFDNLAKMSFFQDFVKDDGNIVSCKMHDLVHDFALFLTKRECWREEVFGVDKNIDPDAAKITRHLTLLLEPGTRIPLSTYKRENLRTLMVFCLDKSYTPPLSLDSSLLKLTCLRTLGLPRCEFKEMPNEIDKLMHLRYLDLSATSYLEELPDKLCNLFNLQTLRLNHCTKLRRLPEGMEKLINLRHLCISGCFQLNELPKVIGSLVSLRTLDMFVVPRDYLTSDTALKLEDLNKLEHLEGNIQMLNCGNLEGRPELKKKEGLIGLDLDFNRSTICAQRPDQDESRVLEACEPHPNLKRLWISRYRGTTFPTWMFSLSNLKRLSLIYCSNCEFLPPLGKLPSLESLHIGFMKSVQKVGFEFLGIERDCDESSSVISFPNLKELRLWDLPNWKDWKPSLGDEDESRLMVMPCLESLEISSCHKLKALPHFLPKSLQNLTIKHCQLLQRRYQGRDGLRIAHIPNIIFIGACRDHVSKDDVAYEKKRESISKDSRKGAAQFHGRTGEGERNELLVERGEEEKKRKVKGAAQFFPLSRANRA